MLETYINSHGHTVYRIRSINDLALIPEHCLDNALQSLDLYVRGLRAIVASLEATYKEQGLRFDKEEALSTYFESYVDYIDDCRVEATYGESDDDVLMKITKRES